MTTPLAKLFVSARRWTRLVMLGVTLVAIVSLTIGASARPDPPMDDQETSTPPATGGPSSPAAIPATRQANNIGVITIHGAIDGITLWSLERRIKRAVKDGADAIVLDIDTPGGEVTAALDICSLLKDPAECPSNTVAWIHPNAYSAGTIIALACRETVVAPNASFGDAAVIAVTSMGLTPLPTAERAKLEGPVLAEVIDSARRNRYDENLVQSFISVGVELWLVEHDSTGERIFVTPEEYELIFGESPPTQITSLQPPSAVANAADAPVTPFANAHLVDEGEVKPDDPKFALTRPRTRAPLTIEDRGQWSLVTQVISKDRLLTVKASEGLFYGLAQAIIANDEELKAYFGATTLRRYDSTWSERLTRALVNQYVRMVLIVIFILALFIELATPGSGIFGATAAAALIVLIGAPYLAGAAQWWDIMLILLGIILIATELFLIPGTGVAGVAGAVCLMAGLVGTFISEDLGSPQGQREMWSGLLTTLTGVFGAGVGIWLISRHIHSLPFFNKLILSSELGKQTPDSSVLAAMGPATVITGMPDVGETGTAETDLRPSGRATFDGRMYDVKSVGPFIDKGRSVRVVSVGEFEMLVEEATA